MTIPQTQNLPGKFTYRKNLLVSMTFWRMPVVEPVAQGKSTSIVVHCQTGSLLPIHKSN